MILGGAEQVFCPAYTNMESLTQAREIVKTALANSRCPAVLCSFGKDSLLLLHLVREVKESVPVIWFRTGLDETFAKETIKALNLTAYSYSPADVYLLANPDTDQRSIIHEYSFGRDRLPVTIDLAPGDRCSLTAFPTRTPQLFQPWDVIFVGWKDSDSHWLKGSTPFPEDGFMLGRAQVHAPLRHMSDTQIFAALYDLQIPYRPTADSLPLCVNCMEPGPDEVWCPERQQYIARHVWESDLSLSAFRKRFNLEEHTNGHRV